MLVGDGDVGVAGVGLAAVADGFRLGAHARLEVGVGQEVMEVLEVREARGAVELHVALPVDGACGRRDLDVDDDVAEDLVGEDFAEVVGPEEGLLEGSADVVVGEEDSEHVVAGRHCE